MVYLWFADGGSINPKMHQTLTGLLLRQQFHAIPSLTACSPRIFQVCDWLYPLVPDRSPVLKCTAGAYMFPDTMLQAAGCFVGVVLSSELPEDDRELFEDLLRQMSDLRLQVTGFLGELT